MDASNISEQLCSYCSGVSECCNCDEDNYPYHGESGDCSNEDKEQSCDDEDEQCCCCCGLSSKYCGCDDDDDQWWHERMNRFQ